MAKCRWFAALVSLLAAAVAVAAPDETTITEVAPGVYFRKAQTEPVFTGCNQGFVVFRDYVLVIDANFPGQAENVIASIRERTDKPIRFVFDTHYHGDHADGNMQYVKLGATIVAQERSQPLFQTKGIDGFDGAKKSRAAEYGGLSYEIPSLYFSHKLVFDDGQQRVELVFFGHAHTASDAVAWLPKHRILFTGDACVNGAFNYTGDSNTESWIAVLVAMEDLGPATVCPGHGEAGGPEVVANQKRWFTELRARVKEGIGRGDTVDTVKESLEIPFYKEWTGQEARSRTCSRSCPRPPSRSTNSGASSAGRRCPEPAAMRRSAPGRRSARPTPIGASTRWPTCFSAAIRRGRRCSAAASATIARRSARWPVTSAGRRHGSALLRTRSSSAGHWPWRRSRGAGVTPRRPSSGSNWCAMRRFAPGSRPIRSSVRSRTTCRPRTGHCSTRSAGAHRRRCWPRHGAPDHRSGTDGRLPRGSQTVAKVIRRWMRRQTSRKSPGFSRGVRSGTRSWMTFSTD